MSTPEEIPLTPLDPPAASEPVVEAGAGAETPTTSPPPVERDIAALVTDSARPWPAASASGLLDKYGRPFDPLLHLTSKKGKPAVGAGGRLICLKGKAPADGKSVCLKNDIQKTGVRLPEPRDITAEAPAPVLLLDPEPGVEPVPGTPAGIDPEAGAAINAEVVVDIWHLTAAIIFGAKAAAFDTDPLTSLREDKRLYETGKRWLLGTGRTKPAGGGIVHGIAGVRYFLRAAGTPEGKKHFEALVATMRSGFKNPGIKNNSTPSEVKE